MQKTLDFMGTIVAPRLWLRIAACEQMPPQAMVARPGTAGSGDMLPMPIATLSGFGFTAPMRFPSRASNWPVIALILTLVFQAGGAWAHGGVVEEDDVCVIKISYLKAHFKAYQPELSGHDEYCEDLPDAAETVFVLEYLHDELGRVPVDFRIIRNVTGKGRFARWSDISAISDLDSVTIFHQEPIIEPHVFTVIHDFAEAGDYVGIVTATPANTDRLHIAVFPFKVGFTGIGYWPFVVGFLLLIQIQYLFMSGRFARWRAARKTGKPQLKVIQGGNHAN